MAASDQTPLGSGFAAKSEPDQILSGIDLGGKTAIVTGGYSGILPRRASPTRSSPASTSAARPPS